MAVAFLYSHGLPASSAGILKGEYYVLGLFALLGIMVLISANSLLTVYLGVELLSLSLYALVAFDRDSGIAAEAAIKYFVLGAIASGTLLYGMSMIYGVTGTLELGVDQHAARPWPAARSACSSASRSSSSASPSSSAPCRSTCGCRTSIRARRPRDAVHRHGPEARRRSRWRSGCSPKGLGGRACDRLEGHADRRSRCCRCPWNC